MGLLPLAAALQSALHTRMLAIQQQAGMPDTDFLLSTEEVATRLGKSTKWVRDNIEDLPLRHPGRQGAPLFGARPGRVDCRAAGG